MVVYSSVKLKFFFYFKKSLNSHSKVPWWGYFTLLLDYSENQKERKSKTVSGAECDLSKESSYPYKKIK